MNAIVSEAMVGIRMSSERSRWEAVTRRDSSADGRFFYSVATTGVYCRPSCKARRPRRHNVAFHATTADAEAAGFRACKRCRPGQASAAQERVAAVAEICRFIAACEETPTVDQLAQHVGWSASHTHRVFREVMGMTPKAYARAERVDRLKRGLREGTSVTEATHAAGYGSTSRLYAEAGQALGMTPSAYRKGDAQQAVRFAVGQCRLGAILVAATDKGICALYLGDDPAPLVEELEQHFSSTELVGDDPSFARWVATAVAMVDEPRLARDLPLDVRGTAFQRRVWDRLRCIPVGETMTYSEVAASLGKPKAFRAVAHACAVNEVAVAIPCHRVVRKGGALAGYRWGLDNKQELLRREAEVE
jgi:AraC family transcriptional regulator, regulatory protein of adaptative response / methylated-DNA-[protein]-cysteine methyltransferase